MFGPVGARVCGSELRRKAVELGETPNSGRDSKRNRPKAAFAEEY
jgi:hypothetical protein